ncbi:MAG TPA: glycosyltransferase family 2 protein [Rubrobacteraceae bacterium]|nr:glycosyltransferase family 2 protein [Rubrobacteraceae bacterium]
MRETLEKTTYGKQARIKSAPFWAALLIFTASIVKLLEALRAWRLVRPLYGKVSTGAALEYTKLSVVIPACNEERKLEGALRTVLGQDYPNLEVILVNDRSTDGTGRIMERLAAGREGTAVIHVEELPEGWLGKNHAVRVGAERACGDWLLLTDADVRFHPATLRRAVAHAETQGLDHLTLIPELRLSGYWLRSFVAFFYAAFLVLRGYYKANVPSSKTGVGIGAFNLIRRGAYQKAGGYEALANRPDDDLTLGDRVKKLGMRQELALGHGLIEVEWYSSLGELFRGVEKNTFAALGYSFPKTFAWILAVLAIMAWPFVAIFVSRRRTAALYLGAVTAQVATFAVCNRFLGWRVFLHAPGYPVCVILFAYALARSALLALARGGVYWRGTFYPLSLLRRGKE